MDWIDRQKLQHAAEDVQDVLDAWPQGEAPGVYAFVSGIRAAIGAMLKDVDAASRKETAHAEHS